MAAVVAGMAFFFHSRSLAAKIPDYFASAERREALEVRYRPDMEEGERRNWNAELSALLTPKGELEDRAEYGSLAAFAGLAGLALFLWPKEWVARGRRGRYFIRAGLLLVALAAIVTSIAVGLSRDAGRFYFPAQADTIAIPIFGAMISAGFYFVAVALANLLLCFRRTGARLARASSIIEGIVLAAWSVFLFLSAPGGSGFLFGFALLLLWLRSFRFPARGLVPVALEQAAEQRA